MGQYYEAIILKPREGNKTDEILKSYCPHDFHNGAKLMESSWIGNNFDNFVESQLFMNPQRVVWAGDYADEEPNGTTLHDVGYEGFRTTEGKTCKNGLLNKCYVVNHDKKQYYKRPKKTYRYARLENGKRTRIYDWVVNPLPILTCEGNGRGGGDYFNEKNQDMVGTWARDIIELTTEKPTEDYTEIFPVFED